jgi:hypothetical protein
MACGQGRPGRNLNIHPHCLLLDDVCRRGEDGILLECATLHEDGGAWP